MICRRDTREKTEVALEDLETKAAEILETMQKEMLWREQEHIVTAILMWHITWKSSSRSSTKSPDSSRLCGADVRNVKTRSRKKLAVTGRCMPFEQEQIADTCVCCGKPAKKRWYTGEEHTKIICNYSELCKYRQIFVECGIRKNIL